MTGGAYPAAMTAQALLTRRVLLKDMGRAGLALMVWGVAACSSEVGEASSTTGSPDASTSSLSTPTTDPTTSTTSSDTTTAPATGEGHNWHRVNLGFVSAYIVYRGGIATVVDTGVDGSDLSIGSALAEIDLGWDDVGGLILTHKHPDHQGSAQGVLESAPDIPWYAGAGDIEAITAPTPGVSVGDGDTVDGLEIIESPGHTAGHISVLDRISGFLITGDALNGENGGVVGPNPGFSENIAQANASVVKLAGFDYEVALFGHGEPVLAGASAMVADLADSLG